MLLVLLPKLDVSFAAQKEIEAADVKDFDTFIRDYFAEAQQKKMPDIGQASKGSRKHTFY